MPVLNKQPKSQRLEAGLKVLVRQKHLLQGPDAQLRLTTPENILKPSVYAGMYHTKKIFCAKFITNAPSSCLRCIKVSSLIHKLV